MSPPMRSPATPFAREVFQPTQVAQENPNERNFVPPQQAEGQIQGILQKVADNPTWTSEQVIAWAVEAYKIKPTTAKQYLAQAHKQYTSL